MNLDFSYSRIDPYMPSSYVPKFACARALLLEWLLTQRPLSRACSSVGDLLTIAVHTPALPNAAMALGRLVGSTLIAGRHVLSNGWPWAEEEERGVLNRGLGALPVMLALCLLTLWKKKIYI